MTKQSKIMKGYVVLIYSPKQGGKSIRWKFLHLILGASGTDKDSARIWNLFLLC